MKPDWKDAPEWAAYLSMDGDGRWTWWQVEPEWDEAEKDWFLDIEKPDGTGLAEYVTGLPDESGIDWDFAFDTLEKRP